MCHTHLMESEQASQYPSHPPEVEALVREVIGRVADKWTMIVLELLSEHGELRFSRLAHLAHGISQKMLTQTVRHMERDGLLTRTVHPVVPPRVEYKLTDLGLSLSEAFCGVWVWADANHVRVQAARARFDAGHPSVPLAPAPAAAAAAPSQGSAHGGAPPPARGSAAPVR